MIRHLGYMFSCLYHYSSGNMIILRSFSFFTRYEKYPLNEQLVNNIAKKLLKLSRSTQLCHFYLLQNLLYLLIKACPQRPFVANHVLTWLEVPYI